ncbi:MAG: four helix bundle protein [Thermodesulfobacteriota bacterium]|nr:four helix bundle protein [Thermodesulfobacteriota bacterium]
MEFNFEKLEVWQLAMDVIDEVYSLLDNYPEGEKYALIPQAKRSVCSIALNLADGSVRDKREFNQYIRIALGSLIEAITNLKIGIRRKYITRQQFDDIRTIEPLYFKLMKLSKALKG